MRKLSMSDNSLSELNGLLNEISELMRQYLHVTDYIPNSLKKELSQYKLQLESEIDKREQEQSLTEES
jgi:hypothetical protein